MNDSETKAPVASKKNKKSKDSSLPIIGWREWVALPSLGIDRIKAKIDSGARTSSLHAFETKVIVRHGKKYVHFKVHPRQRDPHWSVSTEAELVDMRQIKDSGGKMTLRPVVRAQLLLFGVVCEIELTLASRDEMGFRMLLGREALRGRFLIHAGKSYLANKKKKKKQPPSL